MVGLRSLRRFSLIFVLLTSCDGVCPLQPESNQTHFWINGAQAVGPYLIKLNPWRRVLYCYDSNTTPFIANRQAAGRMPTCHVRSVQLFCKPNPKGFAPTLFSTRRLAFQPKGSNLGAGRSVGSTTSSPAPAKTLRTSTRPAPGQILPKQFLSLGHPHRYGSSVQERLL